MAFKVIYSVEAKYLLHLNIIIFFRYDHLIINYKLFLSKVLSS